jgi:type VI protein secretion system component VasF
MIESAELQMRYHAKAKQFLYDHDRLDTATDAELAQVAEYLRNQDFQRHIQPYMEQKRKLLGDFHSLQAKPVEELPQWLKDALAGWDEMIAIEARKFGYSPDNSIPDGTFP